MVGVISPTLVLSDVEPRTPFFTPLSSESDDSGSELGFDPPADLECSFGVGGLTSGLASAFSMESFPGKGVAFVLERLLLVGRRESVSEVVSEGEISRVRGGEGERCTNQIPILLTLILPKLAWTCTL